ncbi:MAG: hypothetical protein ACKVSF_12445 [Alphaproteobacteria bacterium]
MKSLSENYRREDGAALVEIRLHSVRQLFNSLDPAPFHEKDLDADAEEYIVESVRELPLREKIKLVFHLPRAEASDAGDLKGAIHNYFAYRAGVVARELRAKLAEGRLTFVIAVLFLVLCLVLRQMVRTLGDGAAGHIAAEGLLIVGWVAMWRPIQILLYDWWPIARRVRWLSKLAVTPVELRILAD